jgi:hypothetical protein
VLVLMQRFVSNAHGEKECLAGTLGSLFFFAILFCILFLATMSYMLQVYWVRCKLGVAAFECSV